MKQFLLIILFACTAFAGHAQGLNLYEIGTVWKYRTSAQMGMTGTRTDEVTYTVAADTIVLGTGYQKVDVFCKRVESTTSLNPPYNHTSVTSYPVFPPVLMRYDMNTDRVYRHATDSAPDVLHYDFSLQVGDTLPMKAQSPTRTVLVDSILTVKVGGYCVKKFLLAAIVADTLQKIDSSKTFIIQGIGGSNGFTTFNPANGFVRTLLQYVVYRGDTLRTFNDTCSLQLPTAIAYVQHKKFRVYPNPAINTLRIDVTDMAINRISVTAIDGRILSEQQTDGSSGIDVSAMLPGLYILTVRDAEAKTSSIVFAKE